ncbi:hypothetical protein QTP70_005817 [Hemibagrus guttatus]|uniref:Endonuclease/exonuclease/phosphatase domain-containing protein n=1 Tax=Hemibagrus guttatus TaxID=175788 RepID=A0AAE0R9Z4_9TELE|nr:hypothetical protein QTP70_005817 [Hemibagrus guttatus]
MSVVCLPLSAGEDSFELHLVYLELEAMEKQIRELQAQRTKDVARPGFVYSGAGVSRSLDAAAKEDTSQAPGEDLAPSIATRLRDLDPELLRSPSLRQTEILKKDFRSLVEKARTTSPMTRIIMSGPLPTFQQGIERFNSSAYITVTGLIQDSDEFTYRQEVDRLSLWSRHNSLELYIRVYIPPSANAKEALCELYRAISKLQNSHLDGLFIIAGDFNHANLKSVLPKFHQYVNFATRGVNALDLVYTNIPGTYRAEPSPHLGYSDHISVMLILAYRPLVRSSKSVLEQVKTWPE